FFRLLDGFGHWVQISIGLRCIRVALPSEFHCRHIPLNTRGSGSNRILSQPTYRRFLSPLRNQMAKSFHSTDVYGNVLRERPHKSTTLVAGSSSMICSASAIASLPNSEQSSSK